MSRSHMQTRTLTDALDHVDAILAGRQTRLKVTKERSDLASCFAPHPAAEFMSWAFTADEFEDAAADVSRRAPELAARLKRPDSPLDFTVVGHCSLNLRFAADHNGANSVVHELRDGSLVEGAQVVSQEASLYGNGLIKLPTLDGRAVYLYQPAQPRETNAAQLAAEVFIHRGDPIQHGLAATFPRARTANLPAHGWVTRLTSVDGEYEVRNVVSSGEAIVDENGFFARETQVVQMCLVCVSEERHPAIIDGPFLVFFADDAGVHAAAWFDLDSFSRPG